MNSFLDKIKKKLVKAQFLLQLLFLPLEMQVQMILIKLIRLIVQIVQEVRMKI